MVADANSPSISASDGNASFSRVIVILILVPALASSLVAGLRFWIRSCIVKAFGWDDWAMVFAILGSVVGIGLDLVEVHYGFGRHQQDLNPHELREFQKYAFGEWIQGFSTLMWTKVSICLFLLRVPIEKWLVRPLQAALVALIVSNVVLTLLWIFQCRPVGGAWDKSKNARCFSQFQREAIIFAQAVISMISDFSFAAYPILLLWRVKIPVRTKVGLCLLMGLGCITGACCVVRTVLNSGSVPEEDMTYQGHVNWIWRTVEVQVGIIAACIPTLPPGYRWLRDKFRKSKTLSTDRTYLTDGPQNRISGTSKTSAERRFSWRAKKEGLGISDNNILKTTEVEVQPGHFV